MITATKEHAPTIRELFQEYLEWENTKLYEEFGVQFDTPELVESSIQHLNWFMPPKGRLLLGYVEDQPMGIACLKALMDSIGEVKRMYVRPEARNRGLGRATALTCRVIDHGSHPSKSAKTCRTLASSATRVYCSGR